MMWKRLRRMRGTEAYLLKAGQEFEKNGIPLTDALCRLLVDPSLNPGIRVAAADVLAISDSKIAGDVLMQRFFDQDSRGEVYWIAVSVRMIKAAHAVPA